MKSQTQIEEYLEKVRLEVEQGLDEGEHPEEAYISHLEGWVDALQWVLKDKED